ncbi:hypothetical protein GCM10010970_23180 [Silvimonas iriomotensis]|uniref:Uncharacterized protein n=1 Tax=Silvimonas iriomotensis TaxID=449662 RepID=A0ABQ2P9Z9_9NEIS|nr:hypothetical protein GCM10010970_23180 [Silvimonas iriomotensis]
MFAKTTGRLPAMKPIGQQIPTGDAHTWKERSRGYASISHLLRDLISTYDAHRNDAGAFLYEVFDAFTLDELTYVWKWDADGSGAGLSDAELDKRLAHLLASDG